MEDPAAVAALLYQDPPIKTILVLSSFLLLLNAINHVLDRHIYCGLIGQVLIGIAFGTPGTKWLARGTEQVIVQLGYLGLILVVYEGGLNTNIRSLKANAGISALVALTGICLPVAFAFCLRSLASATNLQAFAAGTALCSTSLGTTFTILSASGLTNTRLATVVTSAAMLDDVVGLVLVQVISKLGSGPSSVHAITVVRPIVVSIGLALLVLLACLYLVKPVASLIDGFGFTAVMRAIQKHPNEATLVAHAALLFGTVAAASYAGTSNLFAAYLAGASISWYYSEVTQPEEVDKNEHTQIPQPLATESVQRATHSEGNLAKIEKRNTLADSIDKDAQLDTPEVPSTQASQEPHGQAGVENRSQDPLRGASIYREYIDQPVARVLKPFFFASA